ncbi:Cell division control protein 73 [Symbiodinium microadriaticum]|uniref:Cell division control protein 73 n=1 Tax=Symbiodinium microadriaticum TaxID=2951 RepID=A0A1Q9DZA5_SYMMI|nr:Cell division control protein 73 [Symbiodinium microadriaticum]
MGGSERPPKADRKRSAQEVDKEQLSYAEFIKRARPMKGVEHIVRTPGRELPNISPLLKLAQYELLHWNEPARPVAPPTRVRRPFIQELEEILKNSPKAFVPLAGNGGTTLTVDDTTNGHLLGGLVVMLGQVTNKAIQLQRAVTWLRDVFGTTDATSSKVTRGQLCLAARFLRTGTTDELNAMDCLIWRTICDPISEEDVDSCKETLKSDRPIILVPMNKNAPINLLNVYQFLQEGTYTPPERSGASTFEFESMRKEFVEVARIIDGKRWTFEVRDSTKGFTKGQWKRVVAVVTDGADWQFKDWPFETIVDLFCTIKGIYFREKDKQVEVPEHVTKWRVRIMDLASTHLQHRFQALKDAFWKEVEGFMKSERIHRFSNTASLDGRRAASEVKMRKPIL